MQKENFNRGKDYTDVMITDELAGAIIMLTSTTEEDIERKICDLYTRDHMLRYKDKLKMEDREFALFIIYKESALLLRKIAINCLNLPTKDDKEYTIADLDDALFR